MYEGAGRGGWSDPDVPPDYALDAVQLHAVLL